MNPYNYLFYKLTRFLNKKGNNEWGPIYAITILLGWNIVIIYVNCFRITEENSKGGFKYGLIVIVIILFITNSVLFLNKKRQLEIIKRYQNESHRRSRIGSFLVLLYVAFTLGSIIFA